VRSQANLDALMLLTLADGQGTGDENWSDWKESLVWQLYHSTTQYLADGEAFYSQRKIEREELQAAVIKKMARDFGEEIEAHFMFMPDYYFHTNTAAEIVSHIRLFREFMETREEDPNLALAPAVKWIARPEQGHSEVWISTWDRKGLLAKIAGSLAVGHLNILSADIYTRGDSLVLDIFRVCDTKFRAVSDEKDIAQVEKQLRLALTSDDYDFRGVLQKAKRRPGFHLSQELDFPTRITIDNSAHPVYTLVDIQTPDRLGLLYNVLRAFSSARVNIALSRIATEKGAAIDSFYVTNSEGRKVRDTAAMEALQKALQEATEKATD
jgi:[protein-PII] uridylyltransferase